MDAFLSRKRRRLSEPEEKPSGLYPPIRRVTNDDEESTDFKLAMLASLCPNAEEEVLLEALLACEGSIEEASKALKHHSASVSPRKKVATGAGYQSSLSAFSIKPTSNGGLAQKPLTKKGKTLHLYSPADIEAHTPCSIIHNFLPTDEADTLLLELLEETPSYTRETFVLFDRVVSSPHTMGFYVDTLAELEDQKNQYVYDGKRIENVRRSLPEMRKVSSKVEEAVNSEIQRRIRTFYPEGKKLRFQSPCRWKPNAAFVNCYDGPNESVGYHSDQLTYLGPRAIIGSLSLGVAREFRIRKILDDSTSSSRKADGQGQISIHLPHNSLLVMHAEMQEEWKHSIAPAATIEPHPLAANKRINVTYRYYKESLHPKYTPKCKCGVPGVMRCATRKRESRGRYLWMCHTGYVPGQEGCDFFQWAEFDDDGEPPWWTEKAKTKAEKGDVDEKEIILTK